MLVERYGRPSPNPGGLGRGAARPLIEARCLTQARVAEETGIAESTISEILRGRRGMNRRHIKTLSGYFNVSTAVFLDH